MSASRTESTLSESSLTERTDHAAMRLGALLRNGDQSVGVAESLTGGLLVQALARQVGSGDWLKGGVVASHRSVKHDLLDVGATVVVSAEAAAQMARSARERLGSDIGLAVTGVAGPDPQDGQPPGTVWMAVDIGDGPVAELVEIDGDDPEEICRVAVVETILFVIGRLEASSGGRDVASDPGPDGLADRGRPGRFLRDNGLGIACFSIFALFLIAQSLTGWRSALADALQHGGASFGYWHYLTTAHFAEATFENWESEFLQMGAFVLLTIFLVQKGSSESKQATDDPRDEDPRKHRSDPDAPWPVRRGGLALMLYENSLLIAFALMFLASIVGHAIAGAHEYTAEQHEHGALGVGTWQFVKMSEFWFQSFQNWQSEFLAVGSIVVLSVFLRQQGSAESKPVHVPHATTGD
jgi:PncC family amidohydrolase